MVHIYEVKKSINIFHRKVNIILVGIRNCSCGDMAKKWQKYDSVLDFQIPVKIISWMNLMLKRIVSPWLILYYLNILPQSGKNSFVL